MVGDRARSIDDDVLPPRIEGVSVRVGEAVGDVHVELLSSRFVAEDRAILYAARWSPRRFDLRLMERSLLEVDRAARIEHKTVRRVMRVGRVETVDEPLLHVVLVIAVGVLEEHKARPLSHQHASTPELKAGDVVQVSGEGLANVRTAVVVGVLKNEQAVVHRGGRLPVRIRRPRRHPQPALRVEGHLLRTDEFRELRLVGKALDLHPLVNGHLGDGLFTRQEQMLAIGQRPRLVRDDVEERRQIAVVRLDRLPLSRRPHDLVPVRGERVEHFQFALTDRIVRQPVAVATPFGILRKLEKRPVAIRRIAVGHAVAIEPVEVLVVDGGMKSFKDILSNAPRPEELVRRPYGYFAIAFTVEMDSVNAQPYSRPSRIEEIDKRDFVRLRDLAHRLGVHLEPRVRGIDIRFARQVGIVDELLCYR